MDKTNPNPAEKALWAYAYEIIPSQTEDHLLGIQKLLAQEHLKAHHPFANPTGVNRLSSHRGMSAAGRIPEDSTRVG